MAIACNDGVLRMWDLHTQEVRDLWSHTEPIFNLAFSPDGRYLASVGDTSVHVGDLETFQVHRLDDSSHRTWAVRFSPDNSKLVTGSDDAVINVWDLKTMSLEREIKGHSSQVKGVAISPDGKRLVSAGWDGHALVWDLASAPSRKLYSGFYAHFLRNTLVTFKRGFQYMHLWNVRTGERVPSPIPEATNDRVALSQTGKLVAMVREDQQIEIESMGKQESVTVTAPPGDIQYLAFSANDRLLVVIGNGKLILWNTDNWERLGRFDLFLGANSTGNGYVFAIDPEETLLAYDKPMSGDKFAIELFDLKNTKAANDDFVGNTGDELCFFRPTTHRLPSEMLLAESKSSICVTCSPRRGYSARMSIPFSR